MDVSGAERVLDDANADPRAQFDAAVAVIRNGWARACPSEPFEVDGMVTPRAMDYIRGCIDGCLAFERFLDESSNAPSQWPLAQRPGP